MGRIINFVPTGTKLGNAANPWYSDAFDTTDFKQVLMQLVVDNAMGAANDFMDVKWEISNDLKNWVQYPSSGAFFARVTIAAAPTTSNQAVLEANTGAYMRVVVDIQSPAGPPPNDVAFQLSVIGTGRN